MTWKNNMIVQHLERKHIEQSIKAQKQLEQLELIGAGILIGLGIAIGILV